jgi:hypothetical protein
MKTSKETDRGKMKTSKETDRGKKRKHGESSPVMGRVCNRIHDTIIVFVFSNQGFESSSYMLNLLLRFSGSRQISAATNCNLQHIFWLIWNKRMM